MRYNLTDKQEMFFNKLKELMALKKSPTFQEIADFVGTSKSNTYRYMHQLRARGWIAFQDKMSRTIVILEDKA